MSVTRFRQTSFEAPRHALRPLPLVSGFAQRMPVVPFCDLTNRVDFGRRDHRVKVTPAIKHHPILWESARLLAGS